MALYNELLTSLLLSLLLWENSHSWLYRNCLRIIDLIMDRQSYSDVSTKGALLRRNVFELFTKYRNAKADHSYGGKTLWLNSFWFNLGATDWGSVLIIKELKELNAFLKDYFKTRYPRLLSLQSKITRTHRIKSKRGE